MPITSKEVIKAYFKANPAAKKFYNTLPTFLNLSKGGLIGIKLNR
jgi:hypothetical protein